jgi:hypothetical protein
VSGNILATLLLWGLMGLIGQGVRAVVGLKNAAAAQSSNPTMQSSFNAAYLFVSLMIGFIAGVIAGIALNPQLIPDASSVDMKTLLGIAAAGYAGADFIENSFSTIIPGLNPSGSIGGKLPQPNVIVGGAPVADAAAPAKTMALATHLIGSGQAIVSADDVIGMLNDGFSGTAGATGGGGRPASGVGSGGGTGPASGSGAGDVTGPASGSGSAVGIGSESGGAKDWTSAELTRDMSEALKYGTSIKASASAHNLQPSIICAVGSRESNWGLSPDMHPKGPSGTGDWAKRHGKMPPDGLGWGRGLMQADYAASSFAKDAAEWTDPRQNIEFGCNELASDLHHYKTRFPDLPEEKQLQAAIAAYNTGPGNVDHSLSKGRDVDSTTAGHDYSTDVLSRAAWFKAKGFDDHIATI